MQGEAYARLKHNYATLGYRGHPITKSRGYSVTFGHLRRARRLFKSRPAALAPDADVRLVLDVDDDVPEGFEVVSSFAYAGHGLPRLRRGRGRGPVRRPISDPMTTADIEVQPHSREEPDQ